MSEEITISRSSFLKGGWRENKAPLRPPWSIAESDFTRVCDTQCTACEQACPEKIIVIGRGRYPQIDFNKGECTFCEHCLSVCDYDALQKNEREQPWQVKAVIVMDKCITTQHVICRTCGEFCDADAIQFLPQVGGVATPTLNASKCTGCGACIKVCPSSAVTIQQNTDLDHK